MPGLRRAILVLLLSTFLTPLLTADPVPNTRDQHVDGATVFNDALYLFFGRWNSTPNTYEIYYSSTYGSTWSARSSVPIPQATLYGMTGLSPVAFNGRLYVFWHGTKWDTKTIKYISMDQFGVWNSVQTIPNATADGTIGLAAFDGSLYAMWRASGGNTTLFYSSMDTSGTWTATARLSSGESATGPTAAVIRMAEGVKYLYAFWMDRNSSGGPMWYSRLGPGGSWSSTAKLNSPDYPLTSERPSAASTGSRIDLVYVGRYSDTIYVKQLTDNRTWLPESAAPYVTANPPVAVWFNGATWIFREPYGGEPTSVFQIHYFLNY